MIQFKNNFNKTSFFTILKRLALLLIIFMLSRIIFLISNLRYFSGLSFIDIFNIFVGGLRFDLSAILMLNAAFVILMLIPLKFAYHYIYQRVLLILFFIVNLMALLVNFVDIVYFRFTFKRTTSDIFKYIGVGGDFDKLIPQFFRDFWFIPFLWLVFIFLFIYINIKIKSEDSFIKSNGLIFKRLLIYIIFVGLTVLGIRGGIQLRPIDIINAGEYASSKNTSLVLNSPFTIIKTMGLASLENINYYTDEKLLNEIYTPIHKSDTADIVLGKKNVVIIILESFSKEHIGALNNIKAYSGFTPFLDSLIAESYVTEAYANGKRSIEGIPAILAGIPTLMNEAYITSMYAGNKINSLASLLKSEGYYTSFYHGGTNGTMGFESFTKIAGFDAYNGRTQYNNEADYDGKWGIFDEPYLQYYSKQLSESKQPFFSGIFTLSSHHPYSVPEKYKGKFKKGKLEIQQSIMYADYSLKKFFETASKESWFNNTIFVITADHTSESFYSYYQNDVGMYAIPIIYYVPGNDNIRNYKVKLTQQIDIMPSVLGLLGYKSDYFCFGRNIFNSKVNSFNVSYLNNEYQLIKDDFMLKFDGKNSKSLYNIKTDSLLKNNLINSDLINKSKSERFLKAVIQQYNRSLINNKMIIDK